MRFGYTTATKAGRRLGQTLQGGCAIKWGTLSRR